MIVTADMVLFGYQECKIHELAKRYHEETEAFDRTVCTGPIINGAIMPMNPSEFALVLKNSILVREKIMIEAKAAGISSRDMKRAIAITS